MQLLTGLTSFVALATLGSCQLTKVNDFAGTPTKLGMYIYVPKNLKTPAPIVVAVHHCQGSATGYSGSTKYQPLADQKGFLVIYPNSKSGGGCFDVASQASMCFHSNTSSKSGIWPQLRALLIDSCRSHPQRWWRQPDHCKYGQACRGQVRWRRNEGFHCWH
jgi:hypothetical protein